MNVDLISGMTADSVVYHISFKEVIHASQILSQILRYECYIQVGSLAKGIYSIMNVMIRGFLGFLGFWFSWFLDYNCANQPYMTWSYTHRGLLPVVQPTELQGSLEGSLILRLPYRNNGLCNRPLLRPVRF